MPSPINVPQCRMVSYAVERRCGTGSGQVHTMCFKPPKYFMSLVPFSRMELSARTLAE